jgi:hypothetical protein
MDSVKLLLLLLLLLLSPLAAPGAAVARPS